MVHGAEGGRVFRCCAATASPACLLRVQCVCMEEGDGPKAAVIDLGPCADYEQRFWSVCARGCGGRAPIYAMLQHDTRYSVSYPACHELGVNVCYRDVYPPCERERGRC